MRILIAEDEIACSRLMLAYLAPMGDCDVVSDGVLAVAAVETSLHEKRYYDLICMDIAMPNMGGQEAVQKIRELERKYNISKEDRARIVMITGMGDGSNVVASFQSECDAYLVKPFEQSHLMKELRLVGLVPVAEEKNAE